MRIIIPMAGLGTRLRPHTHTKPKPLLPVAGSTVLDHVLRRLTSLDIEEVIFIIGHLGEQIKEHVSAHYHFTARYVEQRELQGQAHALYLAKEYLIGDVFIVFVDTIFEADLSYLEGVSADGVVFVKEVSDPRRFGVVTLEEGYITRFVEKPETPVSNLAIVGLYYIRNSPLLLQCIEAVLSGGIKTKGEYYLADALQLMVDRGAKLQTGSVDVWADCGKPETLLATNRYLLDKNGGPQGQSKNSVIIPPVHIAPSAFIEDSIIGPYVSIADGSRVTRSIVNDAIIDEGACLNGAIVEQSLVGSGAEIRGRPSHADLGADSRLELASS
jgi:glucose-1-phosphate thymidylyltransferase